jgi:hypothetical protein
VGGIDLAYQRWDDENHRVVDEEGVIFPGLVANSQYKFTLIDLTSPRIGKDYRQPAPGLFTPARKIVVAQTNNKFEDEDDEMIIEKGGEGGETLPQEVEDPTSLMDFSRPVDWRASTVNSPKGQKLLFDSADESDRDEKMERMSEISANYMEDRGMGDTEVEQKAKREIAKQMKLKSMNRSPSSPGSPVSSGGRMDDVDICSVPESYTRSERRSIAQSAASSTASSYFAENITRNLNFAKTSLLESAQFMQSTVKSYLDAKGNLHTSSSAVEIREYYPRMGWHDVQVT